MAVASPSILEAAGRTRIREDRITEVLATVAGTNTEFAGALLNLAKYEGISGKSLAISPAEYKVTTQRRTISNWRIDCEIAWYSAGHLTDLLWIESKTGSGYGDNQLNRYLDEIGKSFYGPEIGRLLTIVPSQSHFPKPGEVQPSRHAWNAITWQETAVAADAIGRRWGKSEHGDMQRWRMHAQSPSAPRRIGYLNEYIALLEREGLARMDPITTLDTAVLKRGVSLANRIPDFLQDVADQVPYFDRVGKVESWEWGRVQHLDLNGKAPELPASFRNSWLNETDLTNEFYPELLCYWGQDKISSLPGEPALAAAITLPSRPAAAIRERLLIARKDLETKEDVGRLTLHVEETGDVHYFDLIFLSEIALAGDTINQQIEHVAKWATDAFETIYSSPLQI